VEFFVIGFQEVEIDGVYPETNNYWDLNMGEFHLFLPKFA
jgi:hypothetical protein